MRVFKRVLTPALFLAVGLFTQGCSTTQLGQLASSLCPNPVQTVRGLFDSGMPRNAAQCREQAEAWQKAINDLKVCLGEKCAKPEHQTQCLNTPTTEEDMKNLGAWCAKYKKIADHCRGLNPPVVLPALADCQGVATVKTATGESVTAIVGVKGGITETNSLKDNSWTGVAGK
jgi:hypothetical protein